MLVDSITEAIEKARGCVVVSGSHGGISAGRFAAQAGGFLTVLNDAGVGKDGAGIAGLNFLAQSGLAACTVAHTSARIGEAASTWEDGVISHVNPQAAHLGARQGLVLRDWLLRSS